MSGVKSDTSDAALSVSLKAPSFGGFFFERAMLARGLLPPAMLCIAPLASLGLTDLAWSGAARADISTSSESESRRRGERG